MDTVFWNGGIAWETLSRYIGPYKVSHWIKKAGYTSQVIDFVDDLSEIHLRKATFKFVTANTKVLAISMTFISNNLYKWESGNPARIPEKCVKILREVKAKYPKIKIVLGGYMSDRVSGWNIADATIMSYTTASEDIFVEYLDYLTKGTPAPFGKLILPNFGKFLSKHRTHYYQAREPKYNIEIDDFKFVKEDAILQGEPLPLDISRGCIFACKFCQYPHLGKKKLDYIRGMEYIKAELLYNYENFGTTRYFILDDTFNDTEVKLQAFYDIVQSLPFKITYSAYLRADLIYRFPNMAYLLQESGLYGAYHGIESLHPVASKLVGKAWSGTHAKDWIPELYHNIWKKQVPMHTNFIVGITGDTEDSVRNTADWFIENDLHSIQFNTLGLFGPGNDSSRYTVQSEFDKNSEKYGYTFTSNETEQYRSWKTDNWTTESAAALAAKVTKRIKPHKKLNTWATQSLLWYGNSKEYIETTPHVDIHWNYIKDQTSMLLDTYFKKLMAI
jgi:hypothetical protein